nr:D-Ala-D-Ala carboxypeptidase family metallohydrolase [Phormidium sp. FACHB-1136]
MFTYDSNSPITEETRFLWKDAIISPTGKESIPTSQNIVDNIVKMALVLKEVESLVGKPVTIHSWFRSPEYNTSIGGASLSRHLLGDAVIISTEGMSSQELYEKLDSWWGSRGGLAKSSTVPNAVHVDGRGVRVRW